jgi:hypothetical protein
MRWIFFSVDQTRSRSAALDIKLRWTQLSSIPSKAVIFGRVNLRDGATIFHASPEAVQVFPSLAQEYGGTEGDEPARSRGIWVVAGPRESIERLRRE